ncbi:spike base protein, RCAP_Rcc01079 family [Sphingomonas oleivorans]|uniref:spike base protein, RCAP_Rcc01079 family n=1 Tax=Sphingomonas oleivorans TaxID=1735121 RepID=UPI0013FDB36C|nr:hypothetical protein [Sphingomonas oleivorans]
MGVPIRTNEAGQAVAGSWSDPAVDLVPIVPNDGTDLPARARGIRCRPDGVAGTLRITTEAGQVRNSYISAGELLPVGVLRVHASGTAATNLEALI